MKCKISISSIFVLHTKKVGQELYFLAEPFRINSCYCLWTKEVHVPQYVPGSKIYIDVKFCQWLLYAPPSVWLTNASVSYDC
jgi:hypothetical protein